MATEHSIFSITNVKESYPQVPRESVTGTLDLSLVRVPFSTTPSSASASSASYDTYLNLTLPSGKSLPVPASTHISQTSRTVFEIMPSVELLSYLHEINDPMLSGSEPKTILDVSNAKLPSPSAESEAENDLSFILEQLQAIFAQYALFANPSVSNEQKQNVSLVNDFNGSIVGTLEGVKITENTPLPDEKCPVIVELDPTQTKATVRPATAEDQLLDLDANEPLTPGQLPNDKTYLSTKNDAILSTAAGISKGLVFASETVTKGLSSAASWYTNKYPATEKPLVFKESTKSNVQKVSQITGTGAFYTRKAVGSIQNFASNMGERLTRKRQEEADKEAAKNPNKPKDNKPGVLNRSLIAFTTILDGVDEATKNLVMGATNSSTQVINHRYGAEARDLAREFGSSLYNVTTVYIDVRGVSRRAILKGIGKGAAKGLLGNKEVVLVNEKEHAQLLDGAKKAQGSNDQQQGVYSLPTGTDAKVEVPPALPPRP